MLENCHYKEVFVICSFGMKILKRNETKVKLEVDLTQNAFILREKKQKNILLFCFFVRDHNTECS